MLERDITLTVDSFLTNCALIPLQFRLDYTLNSRKSQSMTPMDLSDLYPPFLCLALHRAFLSAQLLFQDTQVERMKTVVSDRKEMKRIVAKQRLDTALTDNVPHASDSYVKVHDEVLMYREKTIIHRKIAKALCHWKCLRKSEVARFEHRGKDDLRFY